MSIKSLHLPGPALWPRQVSLCVNSEDLSEKEEIHCPER